MAVALSATACAGSSGTTPPEKPTPPSAEPATSAEPAEPATPAEPAPAPPEATTPADTDAPEPVHEKNPAGRALVRDIEAWNKSAVVGEGSGEHSLGGMTITVDDTPVWPPQGVGCEQLIRCCNDRVAAKREGALPCLLSVTKNKSCARALATVNAIGAEQKRPQPATCDPPPAAK